MRVSKFLVSALICIFLVGFVTSFVMAEEVWQMTNLTIKEGGETLIFEEELNEFPFFVRLTSTTEAVIFQEELGMEIYGEYVVDETGLVGFTPHAFVGFPQDVIDHFFDTVEEYDVIIPGTFWLEGQVKGNEAVLMAEGYITMPYSIVVNFKLR